MQERTKRSILSKSLRTITFHSRRHESKHFIAHQKLRRHLAGFTFPRSRRSRRRSSREKRKLQLRAGVRARHFTSSVFLSKTLFSLFHAYNASLSSSFTVYLLPACETSRKLRRHTRRRVHKALAFQRCEGRFFLFFSSNTADDFANPEICPDSRRHELSCNDIFISCKVQR